MISSSLPPDRSTPIGLDMIFGIAVVDCLSARFWSFRRERDLDQAADRLRAAGQIGLFPAPTVQFLSHFRLYADPNKVTGYRSPLFWCFHVNMS